MITLPVHCVDKNCYYCGKTCKDPECKFCWDAASYSPIPNDIVPISWSPLETPKCECGSDSLGSPNHSHYCPKFV